MGPGQQRSESEQSAITCLRLGLPVCAGAGDRPVPRLRWGLQTVTVWLVRQSSRKGSRRTAALPPARAVTLPLVDGHLGEDGARTRGGRSASPRGMSRAGGRAGGSPGPRAGGAWPIRSALPSGTGAQRVCDISLFSGRTRHRGPSCCPVVPRATHVGTSLHPRPHCSPQPQREATSPGWSPASHQQPLPGHTALTCPSLSRDGKQCPPRVASWVLNDEPTPSWRDVSGGSCVLLGHVCGISCSPSSLL